MSGLAQLAEATNAIQQASLTDHGQPEGEGGARRFRGVTMDEYRDRLRELGIPDRGGEYLDSAPLSPSNERRYDHWYGTIIRT